MKIQLFHKFPDLNGPVDFFFLCHSPHVKAAEFLPETRLRFVCSQVTACQFEFNLDPVPGESVNVTGSLLLKILFLGGHGHIGQLVAEEQSLSQVHSAAHPNARRPWKYTPRSLLAK